MAPELPKLLLQPGEEPLVTQINNNCRMSIVAKLETHLRKELNEIKQDPVFGPILKIQENCLCYSARVIHSFLCRQLVTDKKHELWFVFARRPLRFSLQEFHAVTGLQVAFDGVDDVDLESWDDDGGFWSRVLKRDEHISLEKIWKEYVSVANKWKREDRLRLAYICVIAGLLMARGDSAIIPRQYIILAMDMRKLHSYRWGVEAYNILLESLFKVRDKFLIGGKSKPKTKTYVLDGFSYAFQIWIMEAIPVIGELLGQKLNKTYTEGPRCSNWTGSAKVSYEEIYQLEETFASQDIIYPYISITGNGDVIADADCIYSSENEDARVNNMTMLSTRNHDWTDHVWEVEVIPGSSSPLIESPADDHEEQNEEDQDASLCTPTTRKRRLPDHGAEERKRRLLSERLAPRQGECSEEIKKGLKEMFEASLNSWEDKLWNKIDGRLTKVENEMVQIKESVSLLAATISKPDPVTPSDPTVLDKPEPKRGDVKVNVWDTLFEVPLSQTQTEDVDKILDTQDYLKKTIGGLSQASFVGDIDPSQQLNPKDSVDLKTSSISDKGDIPEHQSSQIDDTLDWLPPPPSSYKATPFKSRKVATPASQIDDALDWLPPPPSSYKATPVKSAKVATPASQAKSKGKSVKKTAFKIPYMSDSPPGTPEGVAGQLCHLPKEEFEKFNEWNSHPTVLPFGPVKFDAAMASRIIGPINWLRNDEIDATMYLFRERTSLRRWEPDRVGFMSCQFSNEIHSAYQTYLADKKAFKLDNLLLMYGKGELPSHGKTNKVWGVDVDVLYIPLFVNQNHWIALRVSFLQRKVEVFDCEAGRNRKHAEKFAFMIPRIVKAVQPTGVKNHLSIQQYSIVDVPVRRRLNKKSNDCGVYALKYIECSVLGLVMDDIDDETMYGARLRIAYDLWTAAQDPELIQRMDNYELPVIEPGVIVDLE